MLRHLLLLLLLLPAATYSKKNFLLTVCGGGNYTSPGTYESNLRALLFNLMASATKSQTLFAKDTSGDPTSSQAFGLVQCRPGIPVPNCTACIRRAANMALTSPSEGCPFRLSAALRSDDCVLRYSDQLFFSSPHFTVRKYIWNTRNDSSPEVFAKAVGELLSEVTAEAAAAPARFSARVKSYDESATGRKIYGMAWCTRDLSGRDCMECMQNTMKEIKMDSIGAHAAAVSCAVKFDISPFSPFLTPPPAIVGSKDGDASDAAESTRNANSAGARRTHISIGIIIAAALVLIVAS